MVETITNEKYDEIGEALEQYLEEVFGVNMDVQQLVELINIPLNILGIKKERLIIYKPIEK